MDHRFLEFMGQYFLTAAAGRKQMDEAVALMEQWMAGMGLSAPLAHDDAQATPEWITGLFSAACGLDSAAPQETVLQQFKQFSRQYWDLFRLPRVVSETAYQALEEKCRQLEDENAALKNTIQIQSSFLELNDAFQDNVSTGIDAIMTHQQQLFSRMMQGFSSETETG